MLKLVLDIPVVIDSFTYICNLSLSTAYFPTAWKAARVKPIFKSGNKLQVSNYRAIAILSVASKLLRELFISTLDYLISRQILCPNQFGFRPKHSCETALLCMVDEWAKNVDNGKINGVALVDLRRAFDLVDHDVLLQLLSECGCSERSLQWLKSYLSDREQFVSIQNKKSDTRNVSVGVPQGSILGPLLFTILINNLPKAVNNASVYMYADDTTISVSGTSKQEIETKLNDVLKEVYDWTAKNKLLMNLKKTKVMVIGSKQRCSNLSDTNLNVKLNNVAVECVNEAKCLGVTLDSHLIFNSHVNNIATVIKQKIGVLSYVYTMFPAATAVPFARNVVRRGIFGHFFLSFHVLLSFITVYHGIRDGSWGYGLLSPGGSKVRLGLRSTTDASTFPPGPSRSDRVPHVSHILIKV